MERPAVTIIVPGVVGKQRPRAVMRGKFPRFYTPSKTVRLEKTIATLGAKKIREVFGDNMPRARSYCVSIIAMMRIPAGLSKSRRNELRRSACVRKPDLDNVIKAVLDGLSGVIWDDDSQVVSIHAVRAWAAAESGTVVTVQWMEVHDAEGG